ncbi:MAG: DUF4097 family beta strand repeat-containing protein [Nocardioides sp.]|uniref:DUF4097 family beta strand repeat-containing protein n=1 Tax=Nocardioides sp. TaxID=35761 RepID=UPI0039E69603
MTRYTFDTPEHAKVYAELEKGQISVEATETTTTTVTVTGEEPDRVTVTADGDEIAVIGPKGGTFLGLGRHGYAVAIQVPTGSQLRAKTGSADLETRGSLLAVWAQTGSGELDLDVITGPTQATTGSGDIRADRLEGPVQIKTGSGDVQMRTLGASANVSTGSGDVRVDSALGELRAKTGSGDLVVGDADGGVRLTTGSGDLEISSVRRGRVESKCASGDIRVGVPAGTPIWTDITTVSGDIRSQISGTGAPTDGQEYVELVAHTVSGDITLVEL